jgi:cytochrome c oxidase subunit I
MSLRQRQVIRADLGARVARAQLVSVLLAFVAPTVLVGLAQALVAMHLLTSDSGAYRRVLSLHSILVVFFGIVPGVPFALGGFLTSSHGGKRSARLGLASLVLFWMGMLVVSVAILSGKIDSGFYYLASLGLRSRWSVAALSGGLLLAAMGCALNALQLAMFDKTRPERTLWTQLMRVGAITQTLVLPIQVVLVVVLACAPFKSSYGWMHGANSLEFLHQLFWFAVQPAILAAAPPVLGFVTIYLDNWTAESSSRSSLVLHSAVAYSVLSFTTWGVHSASIGQSAPMTALFSASCLLMTVPAILPYPAWLAQLRAIPSGYRMHAWVPASIIAMLAACVLMALPLVTPLANASEQGRVMRIVCLHLFGVVIASAIVAGRKWIRTTLEPAL